MDTSEKPRRRRWRKALTWVAVALWLLPFSYLAILGPVEYCFYRVWITRNTRDAFYAPYFYYDEYVWWWRDLAKRQMGWRVDD